MAQPHFSSTHRGFVRSLISLLLLNLLFIGTLFAADMQPTVFEDSMDPVPANAIFEYRIELKNHVDEDATHTDLNISIPESFSFVSTDFPDECSYSGDTPSTGAEADRVVCDFGTFEGHRTAHITIKLQAGSTTGVHEATASTDSDVEENDANNDEIVKTTIVESADLNLTKVSLINPIAAGGIETYHFEVGNRGPFKATALTLTDTLPSGLLFESDVSDDWSCSASGQDVTCSGPDMDINETSSLEFKVKVIAEVTGTIINSAEVSAEEAEVNGNDNVATDELTVTEGTDMSILKAITTSPAIEEHNVTFELNITNEGPMTAHDVAVSDPLPAGYSDIHITQSGWSCSVEDTTVTCSRDDAMDANVSELIVITALAPAVSGAGETHHNSAEVNTTTQDPIPSNDSDAISYILFADQSDLDISKSKTPSPAGSDPDTPVALNEEVISTLTVHNNGPQPATPVQIVDVLDENESYVGSSGTDWNCSEASGTVTCDYSQTLANGDTTPDLTIITQAIAEDDNLSNYACTGGSNGSDEPDALDEITENDCTGAEIEVRGSTDIRISKTTSDSLIDGGENNFTYTMVVENISDETAEDVAFVDSIPQYVAAYEGREATGLSVTTDKGSAECNITAERVSCDLKDMAKDDRVEINITVVRPMREGRLTNTAYAYSQETGDVNRSNNEDSVDVTVSDIAEIELVEKLVTYENPSEPILAGTEATYTIQVRNNGPSMAQDVNVTDLFDGEAFTFISVESSGNSCSYDADHRSLFCEMGDIAYKGVESIKLVIMPDHNATVTDAWEINNTACVVMTTQDSNSSNNEKNATLKVRLGELDLSIEINESPTFQEPVAYDPDNNDSNIIVYEVVVQNLGPSLATDVNFTSIVDKVFPDNNQTLKFLRDTNHPDGTAGDAEICTAPTPNPFEVNASAPGISCLLDRLEVDREYKRYLVFHIDDSPHLVSGDVYHIEVNVTARETELEYANNTEDEKTTVRVMTDPGITKVASVGSVDVGEDFNYTLTIVNHGPGYSPDTIVEDSLPDNMELTGTPVPTQGSCDGSAGDHSFSCRVDSSDYTLHSKQNDPTGVYEVNISVPVRFTAYPGDMDDEHNATEIINTATVSTTGPDTNSSNDESNATISVNKPARIGDRLWLDRDADGIQDLDSSWNPTEPGIANHTVYLILERNGSVVQQAQTNAEGWYGFQINHVDPAGYRLKFELPDNTWMTDQNSGTDDGLDNDFNASGVTDLLIFHYGDQNMTIDGGVFTPVNLGDRVWIDENGDGNQTVGEANVPDVNVTLYWDINDSQVTHDLNGTELGVGGILTTDSNGKYKFTNLKPARYYVIFDKNTLPDEYVFTTRSILGDHYPENKYDSDANRTTGESVHRTVKSDDDITDVYTHRHLDAGIYIPVSIGDYIWHDQNGNGIQDANESNLSDINVTLWRTADNTQVKFEQNGTAIGDNGVISSEANGSYLFKNLKPDSYYVKFESPTGYVITTQDATESSDSNDSDLNASTERTIDYVLTSGEDNRSVDAGYYVEIKLGDRVWEDLNYNGIQEAGEANVSGVTVELYKDNVATGITDTTTATGYLFEHLSPNHTYSVKFSDLPEGYRFTQQDQGGDDLLDSDANVTTGLTSGQTPKALSDDVNLSFDAGIYKPVVIGDRVWEDDNADGIQDVGEDGVANVTVLLIRDGVELSDINTTTDSSGYYEFNTSFDLKPDHNYSVEFVIPDGYLVTTQDASGSGDSNDSDANATGCVTTSTPTMYSHDENHTLDMGLFKPASLGDRVWIDENGNGRQDTGEANVSEVNLSLQYKDSAGDWQDVTTDVYGDPIGVGGVVTTTGEGRYLFEHLRPHYYRVVIDTNTLPEGGYRFTLKQHSGVSYSLNSDASESGKMYRTLISGQHDRTRDAGIFLPASVGDRVWLDRDGDGKQDAGEENLSHIAVRLYFEANDTQVTEDLDGNDLTAIETNSSGEYAFTTLRPAEYYLVFEQPAGYEFTTKHASSATASTNSDANASGVTSKRILTSGEYDRDADAGLYQLTSIGDYTWIDEDRDGIQEADEANLSGVKVTLWLSDDTQVTEDFYGTVFGTAGTIETNTTGGYQFANLAPNRYYLHFQRPDGSDYRITQRNQGDDTHDSDATGVDSTEGNSSNYRLTSGEDNRSVDAGFYEPIVIGDYVWEDKNGNGLQNESGAGMEDVLVTLRIDGVLHSDINTTTNSEGYYEFNRTRGLLPDHNYSVAITLPTGYYVTLANQGSDDTNDSDANASGVTDETPILSSGERNVTLDVGLFRPVSIGDYVWIDSDADGIQDATEEGVAEVNVTLYRQDDINRNWIQVTEDIHGATLGTNGIVETNATGGYRFDQLSPGRYKVLVDKDTLPAGYRFTLPKEGGDALLDSDVNQTTGLSEPYWVLSSQYRRDFDAGIFKPVSIGDTTWTDSNGNGIQDSNEVGLKDVNVTLWWESNDSQVIHDLDNVEFGTGGTVETNGSGAYLFDNLKPDTYYLKFTTPAGYHITLSDQGAGDHNDSDIDSSGQTTTDYTLSTGEDNRSVDAGFYAPVSIGDYTWIDKNGNGVQDAGEDHLADVNVTLWWESNDSQVIHDLDNVEFGTGGTVETNGSGAYLFDNLKPDTYYLKFTTPAGYHITLSDQGAGDHNDSDIDSSGQTTTDYTLSTGEDNRSVDAGFYEPVIIGDKVWEDVNGNGIQESGESGVAGIVVHLVIDGVVQDGSGASSDINATTDASGVYLFDGSYDLKPGHRYSVVFATSSDYFFTTQNAIGSGDSNDSDANASGAGVAPTPVMFSKEENRTLDAGIYYPASLGNRVWLDSNGNGIQDASESGVEHVTVKLYYEHNNTLVSTLSTNSEGYYHFEQLRPASYYVTFSDLPANHVLTQYNQGGDNEVDSDVNLTTLKSDVITLHSGEEDNSTDVGIYEPVVVGDRIWIDTNANGIQELGEPNYIGDINVTLIDNSDASHIYTTTTQSGEYNISSVRPGNYHLEFTLPTGYIVTYEDIGDDANDSDVNETLQSSGFDLVSGVDQYQWDMGIFQNASIGNRIWLDTNANGIQESGEVNVSVGVSVKLLDEDNNTVDSQSVTNGAYHFEDLRPARYHLAFTLPSGYLLSPQDTVGSDDSNDSDVNATTLETEPTILSSGEHDMQWDMGLYQPASIGDRIWLDTNGDGIQDGDEDNFTKSVTVYLEHEDNSSVTDANGSVVSAITTTTGVYQFVNLVPATYHLRFELPLNTEVSPRNVGDLDKDSDLILESNTTADTTLISGEHNRSWDVGVFEHAGLGDQIWIDTNGNAIQDAGDTQVLDINVTVNLYYEDNQSLADTQIVEAGSDGRYHFDDVDPDDYFVEFVLPVGSAYQFVVPHSGSDDANDSDVDPATGKSVVETILSNEYNDTIDAGIYIPVTIGDRVWLDANANGVQDLGEGNLSDINVTLYDESNLTVAMTTTDSNGTYHFGGLVPGRYHVEVTLLDNQGQAYVVSPKDVTVGGDDSNDSDINATGVAPEAMFVSGESNPTYDAGLYIPVSIGDRVWSDRNGNGIQDAGEVGIADVNVTLYQEEQNGSITLMGSQETNSTGGYRFSNLVPGVYFVEFVQPAHFSTTVRRAGSDGAYDSDIDTTTGRSDRFELRSPEDNLTLDAGYYALGTIEGSVLEDTTNNDHGDRAIAGVEIRLLNSIGDLIATTHTDSNGSYRFEDIEPDTYTLVEQQPSGMVSVSESEGGDDQDSGDTTRNNRIAVTLDIGEADSGNDFVEERGITIGDRVWIDENGDGIQDATEVETTGIDGIIVKLYDDHDTLIATTHTDSDGEYLFENYPEGVYYIGFDLSTLPAHYGITRQNQGVDSNDSDTNATTGLTGSDYLAPEEDNRTFDMGIYRLGSISGMVLEDTNKDTIGDTPMAGVTIILYDANGIEVARMDTESDGSYLFSDLPQGEYRIVELQPVGYLNVGETEGDMPNDGLTNSIGVTLDAGEDDSVNDYTEEIGGSIGNYVWLDSNGDGLQDRSERGINHIAVCLEDDQGNAVLDANGTPRCIETNASGYYRFEGILPAAYVVVFSVPTDMSLTPFPQEGSDRAIDSDPLESINGRATAEVSVGLGSHILTVDMGLVSNNTASIGDFVWIDEDEDGIFDSSEEGLDGVTVNLYTQAGDLVATIVTHDGGKYLLDGLPAGEYVVEFDVPNRLGYEFTRSSVGAVDLNSDADRLTGRTGTITLSEGEHVVIVDAGVFCGCKDIESDSSDALSLMGVLGMMFITLFTGLYFIRREEEMRV